MHSLKLIEDIFCPFKIENIKLEKQNTDYEGFLFNMNQIVYRSRLAKLTPKKKGYFVAFWEKDDKQKNQAFDFKESPEKLLISIIDGSKKGLFIFPKTILLEQSILKTDSQKGKMAIRIYPSWETDLNPSATKTQKWQIPFFIDLTDGVNQEKLHKFLM